MKRVAFFGTPDIAAKTLEALLTIKDLSVALVVTQPDKPAGRKQLLTESPVKKLALANNIPLIQPKSAKSELLDQLQQLKQSTGELDGAIVVAYGQILPKHVLTFFNDRCVNIHYSLLPRWRGAAPVQRAILSGDIETGVCLMKMESGLDTGPIFVLEKTEIDSTATSGSLMSSLAEIGCKLLSKNIIDILNGVITPTPQATDGVTVAPKIEKSEAKINWNDSAEQIDRKIRAFSPVPGAFTILDGSRIRLLNCKVTDIESNDSPGTIIVASTTQLIVQTGKRQLSLETLQKEGRPVLSVAEFMRGVKITLGTVLE